MKTEHDIDQLFKRGLSDPKIPFNEMDWKKMEQKLDKGKNKKSIALWITAASGIAAAVLILIFWIFSKPVNETKINVNNSIVNQRVKPVVERKPEPLSVAREGLKTKKQLTQSIHLPFSDTVATVSFVKENTELTPKSEVINEAPTRKTEEEKVADQKAAELASRSAAAAKEDRDEVLKSVRKRMDASMGQGRGLTLSMMAAPDISTAKQSMSSKISSNVGVLATYGLTRKFSVTSGAIYSRKLYNSSGVAPQSNTYTSGAAWQVNADCNILDVPINVNYKLLDKKGLSVSINSGLSSYFMLKEKYTFITGDPGPSHQVSNLEIKNQNQHLFGIANISVSFEHKISTGISVGVQPFMKLPLTGIGYGNADLKSTGMSFSLNIGLFPAKKAAGYAAISRSASY